MRKGIEKLIDFYNRRQNATYEPYISYLRETELPLRAVKTIDNVAYSVGVKEDDDLMKRFISDVRNYGKDVALLGYPDYAVSDDETKAKIVDFYNHVEYPHNKLYSNLHIIKVRYELSDAWVDDMLNFYEECPSNLSKRAYLHFVSDCAHWSKTLLGSDFIRFGRESFVCSMFLQDVCIFESLNCLKVDGDVDCKLIDVLKYEIYNVKSRLPYYLIYDNATAEDDVKHKVCGYDMTDIILHNISKNPVMNWFYNRYYYETTYKGSFEYNVDSYDEALCKKFLKVSKAVGFTLDSPYFRNFVKIVPDKGVFVRCKKYKKTYHNADEKSVGYCEVSNYSTVSLWFTPDNHVLMDMYAKRTDCTSSHFVPAAINNVYKKQGDNEFLMSMLHDFAADLNFKFLKDVLSDFDLAKHKLATITFNDAMSYHNRREFVYDKYTNVRALQIDFNKVNLNLAYALYKTMRYVDESQYGYLSQIRSLDFISDNERVTSKDVAAVFLKNYYLRYKDYLNKITDKDIIWDEDDEDDYIYNGDYDEKLKPWQNTFVICVRDYMSAIVTLGRKVMLNHSIRRIIEDHDELVDNMNLKDYLKRMRGKKLKVPKNSQFNKLRKVLPDDFEWIKTKTRLAKESAMQHHCVWQYSDYISSDDSAIYSYVDSDCEFGPRPIRYTIEFKVSRDGYYVAQMQRFRNRGGSTELKKYLNELIKSA